MPRFTPAVAALAGLSLLLPAAAENADEPLVACETDAEVINEGESATYDGLASGIPSADAESPESETDIVTIAGSVGETAIKATYTAVMTFDVPGDLELYAYNTDGERIGSSVAFNPTDGNVETVFVTVDPCEEVRFVVANYLAPPGTPVSLEVSVEGKRPRKRR